MSNIVLRNVDPPKDDDILSVDIFSDGKARCYSWSEKWIDAEVIDSKPQTNADRIRSMSDEELAEWVTTKGRTFGEEYEGYMSLLDWLKSQVTDDG